MEKNKLTHSIEDYLEMIYLLSEKQETVRITDIASRMHVRKSSIVAAVKKLTENGLLVHERYGNIQITESGRKLGSEVYRKHKVLKGFFLDILKLPEEVAEKDACNIEHYISDQTLSALLDLAIELNDKKKGKI